MKLANIVPWGRTLLEYREMFNLTENDLKSKIVGCGDGPASFNAELTSCGGSVISVDPTYRLTKEQFARRIDEVAEVVMARVRQHVDAFVWKNIANPDALYDMRMSAMKQFLEDYDRGKKEGRYIEASLPHLPFKEQQFDLALSSHLLFLYNEHLDEQFHKEAIVEMLGIAKEVRIFPLVTLTGEISPHLEPIMNHFNSRGFACNVVKMGYEFQKGGDEMLQIERV
jgi:hypothetical protein